MVIGILNCNLHSFWQFAVEIILEYFPYHLLLFHYRLSLFYVLFGSIYVELFYKENLTVIILEFVI